MTYADYSYYITEFLGGIVPEADFPRMALRASEYVDYITMGKAADSAGLPAVKKAVCALAELYFASEKAASAASESDASGLSSESVGSWSRSYRSGAEMAQQSLSLRADTEQQVYNAARRYLAPTGLLYRGDCKCSRTL